MATMLPSLFFTHFNSWTCVAEHYGHRAGFPGGLRSQSDSSTVLGHFSDDASAFRGRRDSERLLTWALQKLIV